MKYLLSLFTIVISLHTGYGQSVGDTIRVDAHGARLHMNDTAKHHGTSISLGGDGGGLEIKKGDKKINDKFHIQYGMLDLGLNLLGDKTDYNSAAARNFLQVPDNRKNSSLFDLRTIKSINIDVLPVVVRARVFKTKYERMYVSLGLGLQVYNFRYDNPLTYSTQPSTAISLSATNFKKDKLAVTYLYAPLMVTFKTQVSKNESIVYGVGITGGYRINSLIKQKSSESGKQKMHDDFNLQDFNSCLTGEIGLDAKIRFYISYQITSLYKNSLEQHPLSFGIRFFGI